MSNPNQATGKGRPQLSPVERELRDAARRLKDLNKVRNEFDELLALAGRSDNDQKEIKAFADKRREICRVIDRVSEEVKKAREDGDSKREANGKEARKALYDSLNDLPELGYTQEEWDEAPESMKANELGRPKLRIEQRLNRAEDAFIEQEGILRKVEDEHNEAPARIRDHIGDTIQPNVGRPRLGPLDRLDRDLIKVEEEIEYIESGKAKEEQDAIIQARLNELDLSDPKDLPGRPPVAISKRLENLEEKRDDILAKIRDQEASMTEVELIGREIDVLKLRAKALKRKMKKEGDATGEMTKRHESMIASLNALEAAEKQLLEQETKASQELSGKAKATTTPLPEQASIQPETETSTQPSEQYSEPSATMDDDDLKGDIKARASEGERHKITSELMSMEDTLNSLLEDIDMSISSEDESDRPKRSRLKDRLMAKASNE